MNAVLSRNASRVAHRVIESRERSLWVGADYAAAGSVLQMVAEELSETVNLCQGERVLDVAVGNYCASIAAARRWCEVTATDYRELSGAGAQRTETVALGATLVEAEAENLPFGDQSFDAVVSTFGAMFAADQERAASEMIRVCRRGQRVGLANWTPQGFIGQLFALLGEYAPRSSDLRAPFAWGTETRLDELFGVYGNVEIVRKKVAIRARTPADWTRALRTSYPAVQQAPVLDNLLELVAKFNRATDGSMIADAEYLEVAITRR